MDALSGFLRRLGLRKSEIEPKELSGDDLRELLEVEVRETLGMTLAEFTAALDQGRLDPESSRVAGLAILMGARAS